jgi:hypothetical protein
VEDPDAFPCLDVERADVAFDVPSASRDATRHVRGTHEDQLLRHGGRGVESDLVADRLDLLVHAEFQIDDTVLTERWDRHTGFCVE